MTAIPVLEARAPVDVGTDPAVALMSRLGRIVRSLSVSVMTTALSLSILAVLTRADVTSPATANVVATVAGIGPSFALNRRWAWRRTGKSHVRREIIPFWGYALASLVVSTLAVAIAAAWADGQGLSPTTSTLVVLAANIGSFAVLWCGQFLLLDRLLADPA
ncbi:MAG: GtrA family protein [Ilumatobacteraceae bacterium]